MVRLQEDLGFRLVTDGEFNRTSWQRDFLLKFENVALIPSKITVRFHSAAGARDHSPPSLQVTGKLKRPGEIFVDDFRFLQLDRAGRAQGDDPVADRDAFPRRPRGDRSRRPIPTSMRSTPTSRASMPRKSATWRRPAAATCRSTR